MINYLKQISETLLYPVSITCGTSTVTIFRPPDNPNIWQSDNQVEAPLCASPTQLRGLTVARLRLAQLVSADENAKIKNGPNSGRGMNVSNQIILSKWLTENIWDLFHAGLPIFFVAGLSSNVGSILAKCAVSVKQVKRLPWLHCCVRPSCPGKKCNHDYGVWVHLSFTLGLVFTSTY